MGVMALTCAGKSEQMDVRAADAYAAAYDDDADAAGGCGSFAVCG
jgi:hypothetical protein